MLRGSEVSEDSYHSRVKNKNNWNITNWQKLQSRIRSVKWCHFKWPWVTPKLQFKVSTTDSRAASLRQLSFSFHLVLKIMALPRLAFVGCIEHFADVLEVLHEVVATNVITLQSLNNVLQSSRSRHISTMSSAHPSQAAFDHDRITCFSTIVEPSLSD